MLKAYKYRIYPNREQEVQLAKTFGCCRFVYNQTLAYRKDTYDKEKKSISKTDCNNYCNRKLKKEYEWLKEVDKFALTNSNITVDIEYGKIKLPKLKEVKAKIHRNFTGQIKSASVSKTPSEKYKEVHDRDLNAAKNILSRGLKQIA